jgi:hypothetical protein
MVAAIHARPSTDPVAALYHPISWFDANTLVYRIAWPFEKLTDPVRAFSIALLLTFYLGFPTAVAYALRRTGRAPWAALLAFTVVYCKSWSSNGYVPFYSASTFVVLTVAEFSVLFDRSDERPHRAMIRGAICSTLLFLAHGHAYAWTTLLLGLFTLLAIVRDLLRFASEEGKAGAKAAARRAFETAWRSLVTIGPSLVLFSLWAIRTQSAGAAARAHTSLQIVSPTVESKLLSFWAYFVHTRAAHEFRDVVWFALVVLAMLLFGRREHTRGPWFEGFTLLSWLSFFVLPETINAQSIAPRHVDMALWVLPLALWPSDTATAAGQTSTTRARSCKRSALEYLLVAIVFSFSWARIRSVTTELHKAYVAETAPLLALREPCLRARRSPLSVLGYAPMTRESAFLHSPHMHQAHETLAALCGVETPVYDTHVFPHNLLPLRYRVAMPAPVHIVERNPAWYADSLLWKSFDLVLTSSWTPTAADQEVLDRVAELVATSGPYRLYRRR